MIEAVIFDMDGLLIDSEPLWQQAEIKVFNEIGVPLTIEMTSQTTGLRTDEVVRYWHKRHPWKAPHQNEVANVIDDDVIDLIKSQGVAKEGVSHAIKVCHNANLPIAVASSSPMRLIEAVLEKLGIADDVQVIHSAHDEEYGKPHPAVYLSTAKSLGIHPSHCVAFEDSINGVISAKAAKMKCIAVPEGHMTDDKRYSIADITIKSLLEFSSSMLEEVRK